MQTDKRYSIVLRGNVQDVGFRSRIISAAKIYNLRGYPPTNDIDGSVKMICEGPEELIDKFLEDIDIREELPSGIRVEVLEKKELPLDFPIPLRPALLEVEELSEISRKLGIGITSLKNIEGSLTKNTGSLKNIEGSLTKNTGSLKNIEGSLTSVDAKLTSVDAKLGNMDATLPRRIAEALKDVLRG